MTGDRDHLYIITFAWLQRNVNDFKPIIPNDIIAADHAADVYSCTWIWIFELHIFKAKVQSIQFRLLQSMHETGQVTSKFRMTVVSSHSISHSDVCIIAYVPWMKWNEKFWFIFRQRWIFYSFHKWPCSIKNKWTPPKIYLKKKNVSIRPIHSHFDQNIMSTFMTHDMEKKSDEFKLMEPSSTSPSRWKQIPFLHLTQQEKSPQNFSRIYAYWQRKTHKHDCHLATFNEVTIEKWF